MDDISPVKVKTVANKQKAKNQLETNLTVKFLKRVFRKTKRRMAQIQTTDPVWNP